MNNSSFNKHQNDVKPKTDKLVEIKQSDHTMEKAFGLTIPKIHRGLNKQCNSNNK